MNAPKTGENPAESASLRENVDSRYISQASHEVDAVSVLHTGDASTLRLKPPPSTGADLSQRRAGILLNATRIEIATNLGIQAKMELNEDRVLGPLAKLCVLVLSGNADHQNESRVILDLERSLDVYELRECQAIMSQSRVAEDICNSISAFTNEINAETARIQPDWIKLKRVVGQAGIERSSKVEYNSFAKLIDSKRAKLESYNELCRVREILSELQATNTQLLRHCELRKKQVLAIDSWMEVLNSGEI